MEIVERITLADVRAAKPAMIYYAALTCWWTHDPAHLGRKPPIVQNGETSPGLPCDPRGSVLFETEFVEEFLRSAGNNAAHYGKHGIRAFMAAHHMNAVVSLTDPRPWSEPSWDVYNIALDRLIERKVYIYGNF